VAVFFLDTSALVKLYVAEVGSRTVTELVSAAGVSILIADIMRGRASTRRAWIPSSTARTVISKRATQFDASAAEPTTGA